MSKKTISFIIPVYDCEEYLTNCVDSIRAIGLQEYEIILIDDGSKDASGQICNEIIEKHDEVRCIHQQNQGVSAARNQGLKAASGEYVIFLDADDEIEPKKLHPLVEMLEKNSAIDMAVFGISFDYYHADKLYRRDELPPGLTGEVNASGWMQKMPELFFSNALSPIWNKIMKRNILVDNQLELCQDMFLYEDLEFSLRCMANCETIFFCPDIIYHYRQAEDESNAGRRLKRIEHLPNLIDQIEAAVNELIEKQDAKAHQNQIKSILLPLYLMLVREKIAVSNVKETGLVCDDFAAWFADRELQIPNEQQKFVNQLLNRDAASLIRNRNYTAIRHKIAVKVKNTGLYQKLKG